MKAHQLIQPHPTWQLHDSSKLDEAQTCLRKYFYRYTLGWAEESPNIHLHYGTSWHKAMEHLLLNDYSGASVQQAHRAFVEEFTKHFSLDETSYYPKTVENAFTALLYYAAMYPSDHAEAKVEYTEISGTVPISSARVLHFRLDSILRRNASGKLFSREHKTGSSKWLWAEQWYLAVQPGTYTHVLSCLYGPDQVEGIEMSGTFFPKKQKEWEPEFLRVPIRKTVPQMNQWLWLVNDKIDEIEQEYERLMRCDEGDTTLQAFPLNWTRCINYGRLCPYHPFCLAWQNPLSHIAEPPIGFKLEYWNPAEQETRHKMEIK